MPSRPKGVFFAEVTVTTQLPSPTGALSFLRGRAVPCPGMSSDGWHARAWQPLPCAMHLITALAGKNVRLVRRRGGEKFKIAHIW